jgi:PAS domain S-box-containing protein
MSEPDSPYPLRETYWRLFENLEVGILIATDQAVYVDVNHAACRLFNRSRSEMIGRHLSEFIEGARVAE